MQAETQANGTTNKKPVEWQSGNRVRGRHYRPKYLCDPPGLILKSDRLLGPGGQPIMTAGIGNRMDAAGGFGFPPFLFPPS